MTNDFSQEKEFFMEEMRQRWTHYVWIECFHLFSRNWRSESALFWCSAAVQAWFRGFGVEQDRIGTDFQNVAGCIQTSLNFSSKLGGSPMNLDRDDGGRECPSALEEWTSAVLHLWEVVWEQCICLPSEILQMFMHHLP
jgi:hypothetical protein